MLGKLEDIQRTEPKARDSRIFPGHHAPVMVMENGQRVIKPMRYQCRIAGKHANYDIKFPGTYNARRDNLEGFWKSLFGRSHGVLGVNTFYENVSKAKMEGRSRIEAHLSALVPRQLARRAENDITFYWPEHANPSTWEGVWVRAQHLEEVRRELARRLRSRHRSRCFHRRP